MDSEKVVGKVNGKPVYFDGFIYYIKINGDMFAVDESKIDLK